MPVPTRRLESGTIWVDAAAAGQTGRTVVYARVSSHDQRQDLDRQVARLADWATSNGHVIGEVVMNAVWCAESIATPRGSAPTGMVA